MEHDHCLLCTSNCVQVGQELLERAHALYHHACLIKVEHAMHVLLLTCTTSAACIAL